MKILNTIGMLFLVGLCVIFYQPKSEPSSSGEVIWISQKSIESNVEILQQDIIKSNQINPSHPLVALELEQGQSGWLADDLEGRGAIYCIVTADGGNESFHLLEIKENQYVDVIDSFSLEGIPRTFLGYLRGDLYYLYRETVNGVRNNRICVYTGEGEQELFSYRSYAWHRPAINELGEITTTIEDDTGLYIAYITNNGVQRTIAEGSFSFWFSYNQIAYINVLGQLCTYNTGSHQQELLYGVKNKPIHLNINPYSAESIRMTSNSKGLIYLAPYHDKLFGIFSVDTRHNEWNLFELETGKIYKWGRIPESLENYVIN